MPWYSAGTVTVTNGSITVTGSGTQFSANVRVGDAFRGPDGGWYEVTNVASATVLSINPPYESANAAGAPYRIAPIQGYVKESADRLRMIVEQWGQELANLAPWSTSPDADSALDELGASDIGKALIKAIDATDGRGVLELGTAALRDVANANTGGAAGSLMPLGHAGIGTNRPPEYSNMEPPVNGFFRGGVASVFGTYPSYIQFGESSVHAIQLGGSALLPDVLYFRKKTDGSWGTTREFRHSGNTTVDSNGFIKNASPITKLYADRIENNDQSQDVVLRKESTGVYRLITERRLATEGWYIETPRDANGNIKVFTLYENTADGILIETFEPDYSTGPVTAGDPVDIPDGRWIDVRMTYTQAEIDAQNVIESTEINPQEADPDE